ncbi:hypothetical protein NC653_035130 [Populus alba x Populus x berolinensis]|uniref:Large ribosomal subunit protein bL21m n=1 Tax=Populus alba x Populus x berolinensis TaxID=444605 RepID=A0AAD6LPJ1_9ROSI|nr:hypothetical protein NC653_035130 [Populus alba x Populus x berolinensis]
MAQRRWLQTVTRHALPLLSSNPTTSLKPLPHLAAPISPKSILSPKPLHQFLHTDPTLFHARSFSSSSRDDSENEEDDGEEGGEEEEDYDSDSNEAEVDDVTVSGMKREYSAEEKEAEAAAIGYKVTGPLLPSDRVLKHREPVFAVVQVGSHQFKVSNGDCIYVERLKFCEVNDKLMLNKVLMLGTSTQTIIGRPILPDAAVHAVVEEHLNKTQRIRFFMGSLGSCSWCLKDPTNCTWAWRKVLKLRRISWDLIYLVVGLNSKVAAVIVNNEWCWPNACLEAMVEVQSACSLVHPLSGDFSVWESYTRWHGFITWMAIQDRLSTKALDAKVIIFKKKRRKNYRRTKGHRQELTRLRIADIQGIEKPHPKVDPKQKMAAVKQQEKVAVAA